MDVQSKMPTCRFLSRKHKAIGWIVAGLLALLTLFFGLPKYYYSVAGVNKKRGWLRITAAGTAWAFHPIPYYSSP